VSPRPRKVSDEEVFAAAYRAMNRLSPGELTLAEIAVEAGVTAGALVQRFGSKRELLLALSAGAAAATGDMIEGLRATHPAPLDALRAYAACLAQLAGTPEALGRSLAYLQIDITDAAFRRHLLVQARATRASITRLLEEAHARGELTTDTDVPRLARAVETTLSGSMLTFAVYQEGTAAEWMSVDIEAVLAPYLC
jgi:AcrR family transcriptional regulator